MPPTILVTGGAGFIGSWFVTMARENQMARIINLDALTYAGNPDNLSGLDNDPDHVFVRGDICDGELLANLFKTYQPDAVVHFAAESHVDRSILDPDAFVRTNVLGTTSLLGAALRHWEKLPAVRKDAFRFVHVSTDEVFGSLGPDEPAFTESTPYSPRSPYSASKAASDHFARAYHETYGLPVMITNCSNNYGPRQFPEKLIPLMILNVLEGKALPVYGKGDNVRDWLHVEDHCRAVGFVLEKGRPGQTYLIGGKAERSNLDLVKALCAVLDSKAPKDKGRYEDAITFVGDRPGHDHRYAINPAKIERELGWKPRHTLDSGLKSTVDWYLTNQSWIERVKSGSYREWLQANYTGR